MVLARQNKFIASSDNVHTFEAVTIETKDGQRTDALCTRIIVGTPGLFYYAWSVLKPRIEFVMVLVTSTLTTIVSCLAVITMMSKQMFSR